MNTFSSKQISDITRFITIALFASILAVTASGCSIIQSKDQNSGTASDGGKQSVSRSENDISDGYHAPDDHMELDPSTLSYADENDLNIFSVKDGWTGLSASAQRITDFDEVCGYWRAVMISDPESEKDDGMFTDLFNAEIAGSTEDVKVVFNWNRRIMSKSGEELNLIATRGGHNGTFSDGTVTAEGSNKIELTDFWTDGNTQYASGSYTWSDGTKGFIGLIREKGE